ncbi:cytochrome P450 monooxygenase [Lineolata rhizophorae]|uniref:Cytochrome P450 monooxygenase n=1 Tax=Lineolata rhizophorae TaxID=578093 RepID=A0A6A6NMA8_9PEZI|nr:cytochrome P450 monooxygenase [Lineolata rhizophorae]
MVSRHAKLITASALGSILAKKFTPEYAPCDSYLWTAALIYVVGGTLLILYVNIIYPNLLSPLRHLPRPRGANPFFGFFITIFNNPAGEPQKRWIREIPNDGLIYYPHLFNSPRVLPTTPKALAEVLVHKNYDFIKPWGVRQGLGRVLGIGILLAEGDEHKHQRRALNPAFSFRHVKDLYPIFWGKAREVTEKMTAFVKGTDPLVSGPQETLEMANWASRVTLDIIGEAGLGNDFHAIQDPNNELNKTYRTIFRPDKQARILQTLGFFLPTWFLRLLPVRRNEDFRRAITLIRKTCRDLIVSKKAQLEKGGEEQYDILSVALQSGSFSDDNLVDQMMTFLAAGHETTASAMAWAMYHFCQHPEVQARLRSEVRANLPPISDADVQITATMIDHMPYLNAVCNEVLRLIPPVTLTLRVAAKDTSIAGHFVPKGTTVVLAPAAINTHKALWGDNADEFNPDRWMGPGRANTGGADSNYSFLTFLHGPRSCIGQGFAKAEFACLLAAWMGRFEVTFADPNYKLEYQGGVTVKPKGGLECKVNVIEGW